MLVILKIPVVYLCVVVWWAIRAKPLPLEPALKPVAERARPEARVALLAGRPRRPPAVGRTARPGRGYARVARAKGDGVSGVATGGREPPERASTRFAGLMSSVAIFLGVLGATDFNLSIDGTHLDVRPVRISVAAVVLALIAAGLGGRHRRLAGAAVAIARRLLGASR